jgi:hypothetical protein
VLYKCRTIIILFYVADLLARCINLDKKTTVITAARRCQWQAAS